MKIVQVLFQIKNGKNQGNNSQAVRRGDQNMGWSKLLVLDLKQKCFNEEMHAHTNN